MLPVEKRVRTNGGGGKILKDAHLGQGAQNTWVKMPASQDAPQGQGGPDTKGKMPAF